MATSGWCPSRSATTLTAFRNSIAVDQFFEVNAREIARPSAVRRHNGR
jgi:hypothetical protein